MVKANPQFQTLPESYLFQEIGRRKAAYLEKHPEAEILDLGIGDTTEPLAAGAVTGMVTRAEAMGTNEGYCGYGPVEGERELREKIACEVYKGRITADAVFISDGAKCDVARLQGLFGSGVTVGVQDPAYPVYVETSILYGQKVVYLPCVPENDFFPDLGLADEVEVLFFCSPNNPTGAVATKAQLERLVGWAREKEALIVFDAAYGAFVEGGTIYGVAGADEVAIELGSFSKVAGFTGVRLGWTVVPGGLKFEDGSGVQERWKRVLGMSFNGASRVVQAGGMNCFPLGSVGERYRERVRLLREAFLDMGLKVYGRDGVPYVWVRWGESSWEIFDTLLEKVQILATPGVGFGPSGEGFMRFSAFPPLRTIQEAVRRLQEAPTLVPTRVPGTRVAS